ncbi:MAG: AsmA family protein [Verrucomicrobiota bacterium]
MKKLGKLIIGLVVLLIVVLAAVFFSLNSIVKKGVETVGPEVTKVQIKLDGVNLSPLSGGGSLKGLFVGNPEGFKSDFAIKADTIGVNVNVRSVMADKIIVESIEVVGPEITLEGSLSGNNLTTILKNVEDFANSLSKGTGTETKDQPAAKAQKKLQVNDFLIKDAKVKVALTMLGGKGATVPLPDIHFKDLGTGPEGITATDLIQKVTSEVVNGSVKAAGQVVSDLGKGVTDAAKGASKSATEAVEKTTSGIKNLFKKKE